VDQRPGPIKPNLWVRCLLGHWHSSRWLYNVLAVSYDIVLVCVTSQWQDQTQARRCSIRQQQTTSAVVMCNIVFKLFRMFVFSSSVGCLEIGESHSYYSGWCGLMTVMNNAGESRNACHIFRQKSSRNSARHFVKFCRSPPQITVNSVVDSQLKENELCCLKCPVYCYLLLFLSCHDRSLRL